MRLFAFVDLIASLIIIVISLTSHLAQYPEWNQQDRPVFHLSRISSGTSLVSSTRELEKVLSYFLVIRQKFITFSYLCPRIKKNA